MYSAATRTQKNISAVVKINSKILSSPTADEVLMIVDENKEKLNNVNITTAIHRVAKICHRKPQKIAKILPKLLPIVQLISERCNSFSGRQLANSTWGLSIMQFEDLEFYKKISEESKKKLSDFEPQHLAILVWSFATMNLDDKELFEKISLKAIIEIEKFSPQNLSNLAWAFAKMNYCDELLFKNISAHAIKTIRVFAPQNISNLIWSFGVLKICEKELIEKVIDESLKRLEEFNTQNLSNLAWSIASLIPQSKFNKVLFEEIAAVCLIKMEYFNARYLSNLLWSFVVVGIYPERLLEESITYMNNADRSELKNMNANYKTQWYQIDMALKLHLTKFSSKFGLQDDIRTLFAREFLKNEISNCEVNIELSNILGFLKVATRSHFILNSGFVVSNLLLPEDRRIAVNFRGPSNFLKSSRNLTGEAVLKERLLKAIDWQICYVDCFDLPQNISFEEKVTFVSRKLAVFGGMAMAEAQRDRDCMQLIQDDETQDFNDKSILEGIVYSSYCKKYMKVCLYDVKLTKPLEGKFGCGAEFDRVEINLLDSTANYFVGQDDMEASYVHQVSIR